MNKMRRKDLYVLANRLNTIKFDKEISSDKPSVFCDIVQDIKEELEQILFDEEYYMDSIPENLQNSYRYENAEQACYNMEDAIGYLDDIIECEDTNDILDFIKMAVSSIINATN